MVVVSVDGDGGGCLVSSCRWCAMFLNNNRDATLIFLYHFFFGYPSPPPPFVIERPRCCGKNEKGLICAFAEDFGDVKKCQKANESGDRTVLLVILA